MTLLPLRFAPPLLALVCVLTSACQPAGTAEPLAAPARDDRIWQELESIERLSRARPSETELTLRTLGDRLPPRSPELLETLALRASTAAVMAAPEQVEVLSSQLQAWPAGPLRASALVAAATARAEFQVLHGDLREARRLLDQVEPGLVTASGTVYHWRYCRELVAANFVSGGLDAGLTHAQTALRLGQEMGKSWRMAYALVDMAAIAERADTLGRARHFVAQALSEALKDPDPMLLNKVYNAQGIMHTEDTDRSISMQAFSDALDQAKLARADAVRALNLGNFADYHLRLGQPQRALELATEALPLAVASRSAGAELVARSNMGLAMMALGRLREGKAAVQSVLAVGSRVIICPSGAGPCSKPET